MKPNEFRDPGAACRGKPFWAWNGKLDPEELRRQIRIFREMGLGGGFMHSRVGLATEFLGREWFECVKAVIDECRKYNMEAWLYDEDRWPSGAAGGLVTKNPKYRMRSLHLRRLEKNPKKSRDLLRVVRGTIENRRFRRDPEGRDYLAFSVQVDQPSPWYNGQTYLDTMSKAAVQEFIRKGYEPYRKEVGSAFGNTVPGIFTDEPNHGDYYQPYWGKAPSPVLDDPAKPAHVPWTDAIPREFKKRYGYDVLDHLPSIFFETDDPMDVQTRYHYHDLTTALFVEAFAKQIGEWCGRNKISFTGHVLCEENLRSQTHVVGSPMRFYEHMQAPGIDILTQFHIEYETAKQCASVLHQMGRTWMLSELYGCTGWHFPFEGHKAIGDWQAALGVNLRCQHLSWYTMLGEAKRDYPAAIFFQSPWWREYRVVENYFSRVNYALTQGEPVRDVLVVHPIESQWLLPTLGMDKDAESALQQALEGVRTILLSHQIDYDFGDEEMLSRLGKVARGAAPALRVGKASYKAVVVPSTRTLRWSTVELLKKFAEAGGKVVFVEPVSDRVDAVPCACARDLAKSCKRVPLEADPLVKALAAERTVVLADAQGRNVAPALVMMRRAKDRTVLFIANTDRQNGFDPVQVELRAGGAIEEWDPQTGVISLVAKNASRFKTSLPASGSRLFVVGPKPSADAVPALPLSETRQERLGGESWGIRLDDPNAVVLDRPRWRVRGGAWAGPLEILKVDQQARDALGVERRGGAMTQPWARPRKARLKSIPVELEYSFLVQTLPGGPLSLALETPERFRVALNGHPLSLDESNAWWVDPCLKKLPVPPAALVPGENKLTLAIDYTENDGLETCFLLGPFGVRLDRNNPVVVEPPRRLSAGDWCGQGLPFYSGNVTYEMPLAAKPADGERVFLRFDDHRSSLIRVWVNGQAAGHAPWPPYEVELTGLLRGNDIVCVEVFGSRRNAFGPLHLVDPNPRWTGPHEFITEGDKWRDDYHLLPYGLMQPPALVYKK